MKNNVVESLIKELNEKQFNFDRTLNGYYSNKNCCYTNDILSRFLQDLIDKQDKKYRSLKKKHDELKFRVASLEH